VSLLLADQQRSVSASVEQDALSTRGKQKNLQSPELLRFANAVRGRSGSGNLLLAVSEARKQVTPQSYVKAIQWLITNPFFRGRVFANPFPRRLGDIHSTTRLAALDDFRELAWQVGYLTAHNKFVAEFVGLRSEFDRSIAMGEHSQSRSLLNQISNRFGESLWLVKQRISLAQDTQGLEGQKRVAAVVERESSAFVAFIAHHWSVKCEPSVNSSRAESSFRTLLNTVSSDTDVRAYLTYHVISDAVPIKGMIECCRYDSVASLIDLHEAVVSTLRVAAVTAFDVAGLPTLAARYGTVSRDSRIQAAARLISGNGWRISQGDRRLAEAMKAFSLNELVGAAQGLAEAIDAEPTRIDLIDVGSRFEAAGLPMTPKQQRPVDIAVRLLGSMRVVAEDGQDIIARLQKLASTWSALEFGRAIRGLASSTVSQIALAHTQDYRLACATTDGCSTVLLPSIPEVSRWQYTEVLLESLHHVTPVTFAPIQLPPALRSLQSELSGELQISAMAYAHAADDAWDQVLTCAEKLIRSSLRYYAVEGMLLQLRSLLELNRELQAADVLVGLILADPPLRSVLPTLTVAEAVARRFDPADNAELFAVVLLDMASKLAPDLFEGHRNIAYEDFLLLNGYHLPSDIDADVDAYPRNQLIYYFRNVCLERIMETSVEFDTSLKVAEERAAVCRLLVELDPVNSDVYDSERKELLRKIVVRKRSREVEQSKIYVDVESVRATATAKLREQFTRYVALAAARLDDVLYRELREAVDRVNAELASSGKRVALSLPRNEIDDLFLTMVTIVRDEFVSSSEHGLDGYLSTRIRHGTLSGQIRAPLEDAKLITTRDDAGGYKVNDWWIATALPAPATRSQLSDLLSTFSRNVDLLIAEIRSEWVQVRRDSSGSGMFDFVVTSEKVSRLRRGMAHAPSLDMFVDLVLLALHQDLEVSLSSMRSAIRDHAKVRATQMLNNLEVEVEALTGLDASALITAIRGARTEVQRTFDRVEQWFNVSHSAASEPFLPADAINIATTMTRAPFEIDVAVEPGVTIECRGDRLPLLVDILINLLENVRKHAGLELPSVRFSVKTAAGGIVFTVVNSIAPGVANPEATARLANIRVALADPKHGNVVAKEGGSGFHKIWKTLSHDFHIQTPELQFGFTAAEVFEVRFVLPTESVIYESTSD
jgi:hypothetical protein